MEPIPSSPYSSSTSSYQNNEEQVVKILNLFDESEHHARMQEKHNQLFLSKKLEARQNIEKLDGRGLYEVALALHEKGVRLESEVKWLLGLSAECLYSPAFTALIQIFPESPINRLYELFNSIINNSCGSNFEGHCNPINFYCSTKLFLKTLRFNHTITNLNLTNMWMGESGLELLASSLSCNSTLTKLNLSSNQLCRGEALVPVLSCNSTITSLDLSSNTLHCEFLSHIFRNSTLTNLNLQNCSIIESRTESISEMLKTGNSSLRTLNLNHNHIGLRANSIAEALMINTYLTNLSLASNGINNSAIFLGNSTLTSLDLSCNRISEEGVREFADALSKNTTLTSLNFSQNKIKDAGVRYFITALRSNSTLTELNLEKNLISGGDNIADLINSSTSLLILRLKGNCDQFKDISVRKNIARTLCNSSLMEFSLDHREITGYTHLLQSNTTLTELDLGISKDKLINDVLYRNARLNMTLYDLLLPQVYE